MATGDASGGQPLPGMLEAAEGMEEVEDQKQQATEERLGCGLSGELTPPEPSKPWKKFIYCEPHKRIKEVLEEELFIQRDECCIKTPSTVALEGVWSIKKNLSVGGLKPGSQNRNNLLPQLKYYSRHGGIKSTLENKFGFAGCRAQNPEDSSALPCSWISGHYAGRGSGRKERRELAPT
ncbi:uncharacterized protein C11orf97 homolog [Ornithorhynchus anatinus]|uniref:Uncharacterized protein n=1 Tax=Ornithorhynchus anatinus TaxID=9258 RepID=K7EHL4_ORNAN|nr:uncharacterized protein C11orf97 homolog [Ornithorhynchus anatinus]